MKIVLLIISILILFSCTGLNEPISVQDAQIINSDMNVKINDNSIYYTVKSNDIWYLKEMSQTENNTIAENKYPMEFVVLSKEIYYIGWDVNENYCLWKYSNKNKKLIYTFKNNSHSQFGKHSITAKNKAIYFLDGYDLKVYNNNTVYTEKNNVTAFSLYENGMYYVKEYKDLYYYDFNEDTKIIDTDMLSITLDGYISDISECKQYIYFIYKISDTTGSLWRVDKENMQIKRLDIPIYKYFIINDTIYYSCQTQDGIDNKLNLYKTDIEYSIHESVVSDIYNFFVYNDEIYYNTLNNATYKLSSDGKVIQLQ